MLGSFGSLGVLVKYLTSRNGRLVLALVTGFSVSILTLGCLLQHRRRRYRAVSTRSLHRFDTFQTHSRQGSFQHPPPSHTPPNHTLLKGKEENALPLSSLTPDSAPVGIMEGEEPVPDYTHLSNTFNGGGPERKGLLEENGEGLVDGEGEGLEEEGTDGKGGGDEGRLSTSGASDDSFHSTVEVFDMTPGDNQLYQSARELVAQGGVECRTIRAKQLGCHDDDDFLAKLHCVRLAFDALVTSSANRNYFVEVGRDIMSTFLQSTNQSPAEFIERFNDLTTFLEGTENWEIATKELTARKVSHMNVYDIALDFILLDAFEDLENPPAAVVVVLQNRWITTGMKTSALSAAIWSISKAKKSMLKHKNGFMSKFYSLSETITPTLAWGFLGTDEPLKAKCDAFKNSVFGFMKAIFSNEEVRYKSVDSLADDILTLAQKTAHSIHTT